MRVRQALPGDLRPAIELAQRLGLDSPGMGADPLWVAEDEGAIVGLVGLKKHRDLLELHALGVDPVHRGKGTGKALVGALVAETPADIHLATIIPEFFETLGFVRVGAIPRSFWNKRKTAWCAGCDVRRCTVMVRKRA
jgi:N-acetylglutamate synthase-like GNAT family acetyltransferase